jgi:hypothetical protein
MVVMRLRGYGPGDQKQYKRDKAAAEVLRLTLPIFHAISSRSSYGFPLSRLMVSRQSVPARSGFARVDALKHEAPAGKQAGASMLQLEF